MRAISDAERGAILQIAERLDETLRKSVLADLDAAHVEEATPDRSCMIFHIKGYERPAYRGQHTYPAEGEMLDADGVEIVVILYGDENNRLLELELLRSDEGDVIKPDWESFRVY